MKIDESTIRLWHQQQLEGKLDVSGLLAKKPQLPVDLLRFLLTASDETAEWAITLLSLLPASAAHQVIRAAEEPAYKSILYRLAYALRGWDIPERQTIFMRWLDSSDLDVARQALMQIPAIPMPSWARELYLTVASKPGHPLRYEAMLVINAGMVPRPRFDEALSDPDPKIRSAAYCNLAIHGRPDDLLRLCEGMNDPDPRVREAAIGCLVEAVVGSDIDQRPPLLQRKWKPEERKIARRLRSKLGAGFKRAAAIELGQAQDDARIGLAILRKNIRAHRKF